MRDVLIIGIGVLIAYWIDQIYYGGYYSHALLDMIHQASISFK
ncbi:MAG: hypothetical protein ABSE67_11145 [Xanthobacteraceae bacterium]|jgi:hypothetical protein